MTGQLLTYRQAADLLGVSQKTIARRVKARALPVVVDGGIRRIPAEALNAYVASRTMPARDNQPNVAKRAQTTQRRVSNNAPDAQPNGRVRRIWEDASNE